MMMVRTTIIPRLMRSVQGQPRKTASAKVGTGVVNTCTVAYGYSPSLKQTDCLTSQVYVITFEYVLDQFEKGILRVMSAV